MRSQATENESRFHNREIAKQLIDFSGLKIDGYIYPTDIDGIIEYKDSLYIIFEIKFKNSLVPTGQKIALERMVKDFKKAGKEAIVFVCNHYTVNIDKDVKAELCPVREFYYSGFLDWKPIVNKTLCLGNAIKIFKSNPVSFMNLTGYANEMKKGVVDN